MANEITVRSGLTIRKENLFYNSLPQAVAMDMTGTKGPTPGALTIPVGGKVIPLNELVTPGWCWMLNLDEDNYVEWGVRDPDTNRFYPIGELPPGVPVQIFFSRNILEEYGGTGTGTTSPGNQFFMKANTAQCEVRVEAFDR